MQRTDIVEIFPEATKEQLDAILDLNGADINRAKGNTDAIQNELKAAQEALAAATANDKSQELQDALSRLEALQGELDGMKAADQLRQTREKVAADKGVPAALLTGDNEEACAAQADAILQFAARNDSFFVQDGGEPNGKGSGDAKEAFKSWGKEIFK